LTYYNRKVTHETCSCEGKRDAKHKEANGTPTGVSATTGSGGGNSIDTNATNKAFAIKDTSDGIKQFYVKQAKKGEARLL
jgi:hypothetical protein